MATGLRLRPVPSGRDAIGGYFALEPGGEAERTFHVSGQAFQSARAAFLAAISHVGPRRVWLPWYLCDSMIEPLAQTGVEAVRYGLSPSFTLPRTIPLKADDLLLGVNYFGLMDREMDRLAASHPAAQVIIDNSQAFYSPPRPVLGNIYSPRKFMGVPDGGFWIGQPLPGERAIDDRSPIRMAHLLKRREGGAEAGYADFQAAEASLSSLPPLAMSMQTRGLVDCAAHGSIQESRRRNFQFLADRLGALNEVSWALEPDAVPLCYPLLTHAVAGLREALWSARIYAGAYWRELLDPSRPVPEQERYWARWLIALPIDQRYDRVTLAEFVADPLLEALSGDRSTPWARED